MLLLSQSVVGAFIAAPDGVTYRLAAPSAISSIALPSHVVLASQYVYSHVMPTQQHTMSCNGPTARHSLALLHQVIHVTQALQSGKVVTRRHLKDVNPVPYAA